MSIMQSLTERFFYTNRREYTNRKGNVTYLDGTPLSRPFDMPVAKKAIVGIVVLVAIALGAMFVNNTVLSSLRESAAAEQAIKDNLARPASIDSLPNMKKLVNLNDAGIKEAFDKAGYTIYDASNLGDSESLILYRLPEDITLDEAAELYGQGVSSLSAVQATKLLNGSWQFVADRTGVTTMVVRYADFSTGDPQVALESALEKTGFDPESVTDSGVDDSGNTYQIGSLKAKDTTCVWKISALPLSDMFSIKNMPEEACYIGIRLTVQ